MAKNDREYWVDVVKIFACILVVTGHFFQSMTKSGILSAGEVYEWFNTSIYYFHVQLFFICSGYLYQKKTTVSSVNIWLDNVIRKLLSLGVPYLIFSILTWGLKKVFSSSVNDEIGGLAETLFKKPASPYWYLYILFLLFVCVITLNNRIVMISVTLVAFLLKVVAIIGIRSNVYAIDKFMDSAIWFVIGMLIAYLTTKKSLSTIRGQLKIGVVGVLVFGCFLLMSIPSLGIYVTFSGRGFLMGVLACCGVIMISVAACANRESLISIEFLSRFTFPVFLMHTLFAAPVRSVLLKAGIKSAAIHIPIGFIISFIGPVLAIIIMEKLKPLDFMVYPGRYIKKKKRNL